MLISYFILILIIMGVNSAIVVDWLNKSLFVDYIITDGQGFTDSFGNGISLVFLITVLLYAILGSAIVSILITDILACGLIFANNVKVLERSEFITFSELRTIASPKELLSFVDISAGSAVLVVAVTLLSIILLQWLVRKIIKRFSLLINWKFRTILLVISISFLAAIFIKPNYYNAHVLKFKEPHLHNWDPLYRARQDGFIPSLIHTVKPTYMDEPAAYTKENMLGIHQKYGKLQKNINQKRNKSLSDAQTIIYLSESLMDPRQLPGLLLNESPIPFINETAKKNIGGTMYSPYIGGGTANIEWSILTSFSLEVFRQPQIVTPYSDFYASSKNHSSVLSYYDHNKMAIHPYTAELYNRKSIYDAVGFDDFLYLKHGIKHKEKLGTQQRVSDESLTQDILETADKSEEGLIHVLSMQNHGPYDGQIKNMKYQPKINPELYPKEKEKELFNYLQAIHASDTAVETMVKSLEKSDKEVNVLFYGDHFPGLFTGMEDRFTEKALQETPWFIFMNHGRSKGGKQFEGLSSSFFVPLLLKEGGYRVSPYQGLMDELLTRDVKRVGRNYVVTDEGKLADSELSEGLLKLIQDYRMVQYDALFGHNWLGDDFYRDSE